MLRFTQIRFLEGCVSVRPSASATTR